MSMDSERDTFAFVRETDLYQDFTLATGRAVRAFGSEQFRALAEKVRYDLRKYPASGTFDNDHHRHLWDEYSFQVQDGPDELEGPWESTIQPHISHRIEQLPDSVAILLTIAAQDYADDYEYQDGSVRGDEQISTEIWKALMQLASKNPRDWYKDCGSSTSAIEVKKPYGALEPVANMPWSFADVEARPVIRGVVAGMGNWGAVWRCGSWGAAPGLATKEARTLSHANFIQEFPEADIMAAESFAKSPPSAAFECRMVVGVDPLHLSFSEIEGRPVAKGVFDGKGVAFVFNSGSWGAAGVLVRK